MLIAPSSLQSVETDAQTDVAAAARAGAATATAYGPRSPQELQLANTAKTTLFAEAILAAAKARFAEYKTVTR